MNERDVKDMRNQKLVNALREHAEWAEGNQWETPITLSDDLAAAADLIEKLTERCARYAAYEDTERTPEEIDMDHEAAEQLRHLCRNCDIDRLEELAEADKACRLVVLPCKVGDTLFRVFAGEILEHKVGNMRYLAIQGRWDIETYPFCPYVESSIGKTIFLTREEAEAALEAMKDD